MVTEDNTYFAFAEADYPYFVKMCGEAEIMPSLAAVGQNICERYLKHVVDAYSEPETQQEEERRNELLRTHSLARLTGYIRGSMGIDIPNDIEDEMLKADGFYFSTRYPGDDSHIATDRDIKRAYEAVVATREFVCNIICEREQACDRARNSEKNDLRVSTKEFLKQCKEKAAAEHAAKERNASEVNSERW